MRHPFRTFLPIKSVVGSWRKVSRMVIRESSFWRRRPRASSEVLRNGPGGLHVSCARPRSRQIVMRWDCGSPLYPYAPNASIMLCVSRNGTSSGLSNVNPYDLDQNMHLHTDKIIRTLSNRQLKSTCKIPPVPSSNSIFSPCLSPKLLNVSK